MSSITPPNGPSHGPSTSFSSPKISVSTTISPQIASLAAKIGPLQFRMPSMTRSPPATPEDTPPLTPTSVNSNSDSPRFSNEVRGPVSIPLSAESESFHQAKAGFISRAKASIASFFKKDPEVKLIGIMNGITEIKDNISADDPAGIKKLAASVVKLKRDAAKAGIGEDSALVGEFSNVESQLVTSSLRVILEAPNSESYKALGEQLKKEHSLENRDFILAANAFIKNPSYRDGLTLLSRFFSRGSKTSSSSSLTASPSEEINVSSAVKKSIAAAAVKLVKDKNTTPLKEILPVAEKEIFLLMQNDTFTRFCKTNDKMIKQELGLG